jgi:hypothetical protein
MDDISASETTGSFNIKLYDWVICLSSSLTFFLLLSAVKTIITGCCKLQIKLDGSFKIIKPSKMQINNFLVYSDTITSHKYS